MAEVRAGSSAVRATATLRRLLDERGVHWWAGEDERKTLWESNGLTWEYFNDGNGDAWLGFLGACEMDVSPEQAIAATLGMGVNCSKAEHDAGGCLGFQNGDDDEPVDQCKACHKYTSYEVEL